MKKILILSALALLMAVPAAAKTDICKSYGSLAYAVMEKRQNGMRLSSLLEIVDSTSAPEGQKAMSRLIVKLAYDVPRFSTDAYKAQAATDFSNEVEAGCYKGGVN